MSKSVIGLVDRVQKAAQAVDIDVSPKDVAFIISLFFEGMADTGDAQFGGVDDWLRMIAEEVSKVQMSDETRPRAASAAECPPSTDESGQI